MTPQSVVFDDFETGTLKNPYTWADSANGASISGWDVTSTQPVSGALAGRFTYDSGTGPSFGGGAGISSPYSNGAPFDTVNATSITLWLKGTDTVPLEIGVMEAGSQGNPHNGADGELWVYDVTLPDTNNWHQYTVPLASFTRSTTTGNQSGNGVLDLQSIQSVQVQVVGAQAIRTGDVWVDDISVSCDGFVPTPTDTPTITPTPTETATATPTPVQALFDDFEGGSLQSPYTWADAANGAVASSWTNSGADAASGTHSGAFAYDSGTSPSFGAGAGEASPKTNGAPLDTVSPSAITVWLKGQAGLQVQLQVMEGNDNGADGELWSTATFGLSDGNWNAYSFSPGQFSRSNAVGNQSGNNSFDLQSVAGVQVQVLGNQGAGTLNIDDISVTCVDLAPTATPTATATQTPVGTPGVFEDFENGLANPYSFNDGQGSILSYSLDGEDQTHGGKTSLQVSVSTVEGQTGAGVGFQSSYGQPFNASGQDRVRFWVKTNQTISFQVVMKEANVAGSDPSNEAWVSNTINLGAGSGYQMVEVPFNTLGEDLNNPDCASTCSTTGNNSFDSGVINTFELDFNVNGGTIGATVQVDDIAFDSAPYPTPTIAPTNAATPITINSFLSGDTTQSTLVLSTCVNDASRNIAGDLYTFTLTQPSNVSITLCGGATFDTVLALFGDSQGNNTIDCNDDTCDVQSEVDDSLAAGTYWFYVTPYNSGEGGSGAYTVSLSASGGPSVPLDAAVEEPGRVFNSGGDAPWFGQTGISHFGGSSAQSGPIMAGQTSWMESVYKGPATLDFDWKISGSSNDELDVMIDGSTYNSINGVRDWQHDQFAIPAGTHTVRWFYNKQFIGNTAWVDHIVYTNLGTPTATPNAAASPTPTQTPICPVFSGPTHYVNSATGFNWAHSAVVLGSTVYVTDYQGSHRVYSFDLSGNALSSFGGFGVSTGQFDYPTGIATDGTYLYTAEMNLSRVQVFDASGNFVRSFSSSDIDGGIAIAVSAGDIYVASYNNGGEITHFDTNGNTLYTWVPVHSSPTGLLVSGGVVTVLTASGWVERYDLTGNPISSPVDLSGNGCGQLFSPQCVAFDGAGGYYVANNLGNGSVERYDSSWNNLGSLYSNGSTGNLNPYGVATGPGGQLYVANGTVGNLLVFDSNFPTATDTFTVTPTPSITPTPTITPTYMATPISIGASTTGDLSTAGAWITNACDPSGDGPFPGDLYTFTVATRSAIDISLCGGSDHDTTLALFSDMAGSNVLACNDDACDLRSEIIQTLDPGTYYFYVSAYDADDLLDYQVSVTDVSAPTGLDTAVDLPGQNFTTGGDTPWAVDNAISFFGGSSAHSGLLQNGQESWIESSFTGPISVNYTWQVSGIGGDWGTVEVDGVQQDLINNAQSWTQSKVNLSAGNHTVRWTYYRATTDGRLWLDKVFLSPYTTLDMAAGMPGQVFVTGGASNWAGQLNTVHTGGTPALESGPLLPGEGNYIETQFNGPGTLAFWWQVDDPNDSMTMLVDGSSSGYGASQKDGGWTYVQALIGSGSHTVRWAVSNNSEGGSGTNALSGFLSEMSFTPAPACDQAILALSQAQFSEAMGPNVGNGMVGPIAIPGTSDAIFRDQDTVIETDAYGTVYSTIPSSYAADPTDKAVMSSSGLLIEKNPDSSFSAYDPATAGLPMTGNFGSVTQVASIATDGNNVFVADAGSGNVDIMQITFPDGPYVNVSGSWPYSATADLRDMAWGGGYIFAADADGSIDMYSDQGAYVGSWTGTPGTPLSIAADDQFVYIADGANIYRYDYTVAGDPPLVDSWPFAGTMVRLDITHESPTLWALANGGPDGPQAKAFMACAYNGPQPTPTAYTTPFETTPTMTPPPTNTPTQTPALGCGTWATSNVDLTAQGLGTQLPSVAAVPGGYFVIDQAHNRVVRLDDDNHVLFAFGGQGTASGRLINPTHLLVVGTSLIVSDGGNSRVQVFDLNGNYKARFGSPGSSTGQFNGVGGLASDGSNLWVADKANARIQEFRLSDYSYESSFTVNYSGQAEGLLWYNGYLYVTDPSNHTLSRYTDAGVYVNSAPVVLPYEVATDGSSLFVSDTGSNWVVRYDLTVGFVDELPIGAPQGVAVSADHSRVYVVNGGSSSFYNNCPLPTLTPSPTPTATFGCTQILGNFNASNGESTLPGNTVFFTRYQASSSATINELAIGGPFFVGPLRVGLYMDVSGTPGALMTQSVDYNPATPSGSFAIPVPGVAVTAGTYYWVALEFSASSATGVNLNGNMRSIGQTYGNLPVDASAATAYSTDGFVMIGYSCTFPSTVTMSPTFSPSPTASPSPVATVCAPLFGSSLTGVTTLAAVNTTYYSRFTNPSAVTVTALQFLAVGGSSNAQIAIYSDVAGVPGFALSYTNTFSAGTGWNLHNITPIGLQAGQNYWLSIITDGDGIQLASAFDASGLELKTTEFTMSGTPGNFPTSTVSLGTYSLAFQAVGCTAVVVGTPTRTPSFTRTPSASPTPSRTFTQTPTASPSTTPSVTPTLCTSSVAAGSGNSGGKGDGGPAGLADLGGPWSVDIDNSGDLYISEPGLGNIRQVTYSGSAYASGTITSLVGQGSPEGLVVDGNKNLFYTDPSDSTVRELAHGNSITAIVAGTGFAGSSGLSSTALSTTLPLNMPQGLALSSDGTVFIADTGNHAVRHVAAGSLMSTIAGTGIAGFDGPTASGAGTALSLSNPVAVAVAGNGDVYIADQGNHAIRLWHQGTLSTVLGSGSAGNSGDGPATAGSAITDPEGVAIDGAGALFFTEGSAGRVRRFYQGQLSTLAVGLNSPRQLVITHTGDILVAAFGGNQLIALGACGIAVAHPNYPVCLPGSLLASARGGGKSAWASDEASSFVVAPNPAVSGGDLCLHFSSAPQSSAWSVYNILGELVLKASFYGQAEQCVANSLAPGVYFVRVDSRGSSGTTRSELRKVAVIR